MNIYTQKGSHVVLSGKEAREGLREGKREKSLGRIMHGFVELFADLWKVS